MAWIGRSFCKALTGIALLGFADLAVWTFGGEPTPWFVKAIFCSVGIFFSQALDLIDGATTADVGHR